MQRVLSLAVVVASLAAACASPQPLVRMVPLSENVLWARGVPALVKDGKAARVGVAFAREQEGLVGFHVEVENLGMTPMIVGPRNFYHAACAATPDGRSRTCRPSQWVMDPERVLLDLDVTHARKQAHLENRLAVTSVFILLDLGASIAAAAHGKHRAATVGLVSGAVAVNTAGDIVAEREHESATYESRRDRWENYALRKTTLMPGQRMAGLVYLERDTTAAAVSLHFTGGGDLLEFPFAQQLIDTRRKRTVADRPPAREWRGP